MEKELEQVAKAFCKKYGFNLVFVNQYKIGYETKEKEFFSLSWGDLFEILKTSEGLQNDNKED